MSKKQHISLSHCDNVKQITENLLNELGFSSLLYHRINETTGEKSVLSNNIEILKLNYFEREFCTNTEWGDFYTPTRKLGQFETRDSYLAKISQKQKSFCNASYKMEEDRINQFSQASISIQNNQANKGCFTEVFEFYASDNKTHSAESLLSQQTNINNFVYLFREKARDLIKDTVKNPVYRYKSETQHQAPKSTKPAYRKVYLDSSQSDLYITVQEARCIAWMMRCRTLKEIGELLNISPRTVANYIENASLRLRCQSRPELYDLLTLLNFNRDLFY